MDLYQKLPSLLFKLKKKDFLEVRNVENIYFLDEKRI